MGHERSVRRFQDGTVLMTEAVNQMSPCDHPLIQGLLEALPPPGQHFSEQQRRRWLEAVRVNFDFVYGLAEEVIIERLEDEIND